MDTAEIIKLLDSKVDKREYDAAMNYFGIRVKDAENKLESLNLMRNDINLVKQKLDTMDEKLTPLYNNDIIRVSEVSKKKYEKVLDVSVKVTVVIGAITAAIYCVSQAIMTIIK